MTDEEFIKEMEKRFPDDVGTTYKYWVKDLNERFTKTVLINSFNNSTESWKYLIARELQRRMPEKEQRLELVILVGPYLME